MRKIFLKVSIFALVLCQICGAFFACQPTQEPSTDTENTGDRPAEIFSLTKENLSEYTLVVSSLADRDVIALARQLQTIIKTSFGVELGLGTDTADEQACEILVGNSERGASQSFHAELKRDDYGYAMICQKVVLGGYTTKAVERSIALWNMDILQKATDLIMQSGTDRTVSGQYTYDALTLNGTDIGKYRIVYPSKYRLKENEYAAKLASYIAEKTGIIIDTVEDTAEATDFEIHIGKTATATAAVGDGQYEFTVDGNKIYIVGNTATALNAAMSKLLSLIKVSERSASLELSTQKYDIEQLKLNVMTYNVLYKDITSSRSEALMSFLEQADNDIFGLNEIVPEWTKKLTNRFSASYGTVEGKASSGTANGLRNSIFWKKDKFELLESGTLWLSDTPDRMTKYSESTKYCTCVYVKLREKASGTEFFYIQTHLENTGTNPDAATARKKQSQALKKITDGFLFVPIIVGGDFNAGNRGDVSPIYTNTRFADTYDIAGEKIGIKGTYVDNGVPSENWKIDYIFVTKDSISVSKHETVNNKVGNSWPSDHLPVKVELTINH